MGYLRHPSILLFLVFSMLSIGGCGGGGGGEGDPPPPTPIVVTLGAAPITSDGGGLNGTVNPNGLSTEAWFEWGTDSNLTNSDNTARRSVGSGTSIQQVFEPLAGLSFNTRVYFRLVASNSAGESKGDILSFFTSPVPPTANTFPATGITTTEATLNGTVNPNGLSTQAWFEWGTEPNLTNFNPTAIQNIGSGRSVQQISIPLSNLSAASTYFFRVVASSSAGESLGTINSFTTSPNLPVVLTLPATSITTSGATLNGTVNPNGAATQAWFQYGTDPSFSSFAETAPQPVGSGTNNQPVSTVLSTLKPWRTYYFRVVASNSGGSQTGTASSFPTGEYYVAVGDSITRGSHDDIPGDDTSLDGRNTGGGYEPILNNLLTAEKGYPHTVENEGVSGDTSAIGALVISDTLLAHPLSNYVLVMYGTNDASLFPPVPSGRLQGPGDPGYSGSYKDNMQQIISAILAAGKTPYLAKVPYTTDLDIDLSAIQEYNEVIMELFFDNDIFVIPPDFFTYYQLNPGELDDGIHPNGVGYQSMADLWFDALTAP